MPEIDIRLDHVTKKFGALLALDQVNLEIEKGEFFCIIGPAGCGKTVLLRLINGFETPTEGDIYFRQQRVNDIPAYKRGIPTVFQNFALFPHKTVFENISYGLKVRKLPESEQRQKVRDVMEKLDILELVDRYPNQISGGQKQRVGLARALVVEPPMLLLDEPLGALDANLRLRMQTELKNLHEKLGITFILVTSNRTEAFTIGSRVMVMDMARVAQIGTPDQIKNTPANEYVARFCGHINVYPGKIRGINGEFVIVESSIGTLRAMRPAWEPKKGDAVKVFVRPDGLIVNGETQAIEVSEGSKVCAVFEDRSPQKNDNHVAGIGKFTELTGSIVTLFFELKDGSEILVEKHVSKYQRLERGKAYGLYWSPWCTGIIR
jgi:ABC-type Fe3+/spermidine/putrescine transport system ATPase subunit